MLNEKKNIIFFLKNNKLKLSKSLKLVDQVMRMKQPYNRQK